MVSVAIGVSAIRADSIAIEVVHECLHHAALENALVDSADPAANGLLALGGKTLLGIVQGVVTETAVEGNINLGADPVVELRGALAELSRHLCGRDDRAGVVHS